MNKSSSFVSVFEMMSAQMSFLSSGHHQELSIWFRLDAMLFIVHNFRLMHQSHFLFFFCFIFVLNSVIEYSNKSVCLIWTKIYTTSRTISPPAPPVFLFSQCHNILQLLWCNAEFRRSVNQSKETLWIPTVNCRLLHFSYFQLWVLRQKFAIPLSSNDSRTHTNYSTL